MKPLYSSRPCRLHPAYIAAVCQACHDAAELQQARQWLRIRQEAHRIYLERLEK